MPRPVLSPRMRFHSFLASLRAPASLLALAVAVCMPSVLRADDVEPEVGSAEPRAADDGWLPDMNGLRSHTTPLQMSLLAPVQIFAADAPVRGLRINAIYGEQESVWGLDVGTANSTTTEVRGLQIGAVNWSRDFHGLQIGAMNLNESRDASMQTGVRVNLLFGTQAKLRGLDVGTLNMTTKDLRGLQAGVVNAGLGNGLGAQFGVGNVIEGDFSGLQIGVGNTVGGKGDVAQIGFANTAGEGARLQIGITNHAKALRGVQIGLININEAKSLLLVMPVINVGW